MWKLCGVVFLSLGLFATFSDAGFFDWINRCDEITEPNVCAIVYDDDNCNRGDWTPLKIMVYTPLI